ncbi:16992_t:CDS:2, partial [Entrophospora sp. SA101]
MTGNSGNRQSSLSFMKELLPKYFSSQWSFAHFKLPDHCYCRCICGFGNEDSVIVICANGDFYRVRFDSSKGGECKIEPSSESVGRAIVELFRFFLFKENIKLSLVLECSELS